MASNDLYSIKNLFRIPFWTIDNFFDNLILIFLLKNTKLITKKKEQKVTQVFQYFESVRKVQTNIYFLGLNSLTHLFRMVLKIHTNLLHAGSFT